MEGPLAKPAIQARTRDRAFAHGLVHSRHAVLIDSRCREARNEFVAMAALYARLHDGARLPFVLYYLPNRALRGTRVG